MWARRLCPISLLCIVRSLVVPAAFADPQWVERAVPGPSPRCEFGFAYDSGRAVAVLFGGSSNLSFAAVNRETWEWDGTQWVLRSTTGPSQRCDQAFAYDSNRHRVVSFGGFNGAYLSDTWEWDGTSWVNVPGAGPSARADAFMVFDSIRNVMVLFGGQAASGQIQSDTWEYNGTWVRRALTGPSRRWIARMAFDRARGRVVLFGGAGSIGLLSDTWEWDGTTWTQVSASGPVARYGNAMCYDTDRQLSVLFGGQTGFDFGDGPLGDTWEYNGTTWTERAIAGPGARTFVKMVYDEAHHRAVLFGGWDGAAPLADTWELVNDGPVPATVSLAQADARPDRVTLAWQVGGGASSTTGIVHRRGTDGERIAIGTVHADGAGLVRYEDTDVTPGARYGYQLEWQASDGAIWTAETWVEVPALEGLRLQGFDPNPARSELRVSFSLPSADPARLEVLDLAGRTMLLRDLAGGQPGARSVSLGSAGRFAAGVYWVRLTQGASRRAVRGVILR